MKLSIIVPVYNAEKYLEECITSVIQQTNDNWELILVNDGSVDQSGEICNSYADRYPQQIFAFHKQNEGQFLTRQYGISKSHGNYIGFLDADDFLHPEYVDKVMNAVCDYQNPQAICFGFYEWNGEVVKTNCFAKTEFFGLLAERKTVYTQIVEGALTGSLCSKVFSKDLVECIDYDESTVSKSRYGEDAFQSINILSKADSIVYLSDGLYYYRANPSGASLGFDVRPLDYFNTKYVFEFIEQSLPFWDMDCEDVKKHLYARNFNETVYYALKFYRSAKTNQRRRNVVEYDWNSYLLDETFNWLQDNEYVRASYLKVWNALERKAHTEIYIREKLKKYIGW